MILLLAVHRRVGDQVLAALYCSITLARMRPRADTCTPLVSAQARTSFGRARTLDGHEVPLVSYAHFVTDDVLQRVVLERMLAGVATRRHPRIAELVGEALSDGARSTSRLAVSRQFVSRPRPRWPSCSLDLTGKDTTRNPSRSNNTVEAFPLLVASKEDGSTPTTLRSHEPHALTTRRSPCTAKSQ
jgi:hypothetical protein